MIETASSIKTLSVVIIAISLMAGMGVVILDNMRVSTAVLEYQTTVVANYSVTNASTMTLTHGLINPSSLVVWNGTANKVSVPAANITLTCPALDRKVNVDGTACTLTRVNSTGGSFLGDGAWVFPASINVQYTYEKPLTTNSGYADATLGITAMSTIGSFLPIVALVVIAGVIIVLVGRSFSSGGL